MNKWKELDKKQTKFGEELKELLETKYDKVEIAQVNLGAETNRGILVDIYQNKYDYKEINLKYPTNGNVIDYFQTVVYAMDCKKWSKEHISISIERIIIDLIEEFSCENLKMFEYELISFKNEYTIDTQYIQNIKIDFVNKIMKIEEEDEGIFLVDLKEGTIEMLQDFNNEEPITHDFIEELFQSFNKKKYWCELKIDSDEIIWLKDRQDGEFQELLGLDDIREIVLKNEELIVIHDEDKNGFTGFVINQFGIEY